MNKSSNPKQMKIKWVPSSKGNEPHALLINKASGLAEDCSCGDRVHRGRKSGKACKHMKEYNTPIMAAKMSTYEQMTLIIKLSKMLRVKPVTPATRGEADLHIKALRSEIKLKEEQAEREMLESIKQAHQQVRELVPALTAPDWKQTAPLNGNRGFNIYR